jgi:hypothetical protein
VPDWREREARNQSVFRELNEWTRDENETASGSIGTCASAETGCTCSVSLTGHEYETVRTSPTMFAIAINHENPESDHVVSENRVFAAIETCFGEARLIALAANPRS